MDLVALGVFALLFIFVTLLGFFAARWRAGDLDQLHEWGLGGRRFGTVVTWFLLGGDLYTAYTFIAVPAAVFGQGAIGLFALPYTILIYPFVFVVMPRLWSVCRTNHYITGADFVRGRYDSHLLALAVAFTGILATMPYIALQLVGIQVVLAAMGVPSEFPLVIAFIILAAYTYFSGLRAPAMIAIVKDIAIYITVIVAIVVIPTRLGGYGAIFAAVPPQRLLLTPGQITAYATLALGSALALFMYPHSITGILSSNSRVAIKRNAALLPAYSFLLGLIGLLGYMGLAAGVQPQAPFGAQWVVPGLFLQMFPSWFIGFAFAAIAIGALVPASIMSIAAANLFTRNIWREYIRPNLTDRDESQVAKLVSLVVKAGALFFIVFLPTQYAINLQLLGGVWIIQILPAVVVGLYTRWLHRTALLIGWAIGMLTGTAMAVSQNFASVYPLQIGGSSIAGYAALYALILNFVVTIVLTWVFNALALPAGADQTAQADYTALARAPS
ncbi:MAG TPA: sodium:solute symporter [Chloroflexota bacterium]|jgi:SSS family solute:Na+ symporter|nr:sodium:solute symporter [Chloroflexota bacterium]